jgi:hypothetical protein
MRTDLEDALVPVKWAEAQIPVLQRRIEAWHRTDPYRIVLEEYPDKPDWELLVAYPDKPLDHLIVGDVGAIISSVRTALNLLLSAVIARHGIQPERAPDFPISKTAADFEGAVKDWKTNNGFPAPRQTRSNARKPITAGIMRSSTSPHWIICGSIRGCCGSNPF